MGTLPVLEAGSVEEVINTYKSTVYAIALTRTNNRFDADDIFQDVFLTYHRKQPQFNEEEHRKAWLIKTTINCARMFMRKNRRGPAGLSEELEYEAVSLENDDDEAVYTALCELPEKYRMVLYLYYFEDMSTEQIAKTLKLRPGTVRMQMTRGRELMHEKLEGEVFENE